jgi:hypothetical protein
MIQKPLPWVEVGKSSGVLVGICEWRLSPPEALVITLLIKHLKEESYFN